MSEALTPEDRARLEELFDQAAEQPAAEHAAFLERECGQHPLLRARLARLLRGLVGDDPVGARMPGAPLPAGTRIDRYELIERLGEGGMGEVYAARQREPVTREVALKLIKPGMDSARVVQRFEAERQALALMAHPAVAQVFDGGLTEQGKPYFVMERVHGLPITTHCDQHGLPIRARLELFLEVCAGVEHAHQKGIIHRDLKPSNVLVATVDGHAVPKIIDFGVARATSGSLTEDTLQTVIGQVVGTLDYMSPEQADPGGARVDTRSDVYSLGVVLYQLLTGLLPFDHGSLLDRPLSEVQRAIREAVPPTPSTRLRRESVPAATSARRHGTDVNDLVRQLTGDLDWICLKALEKEPARRYQSASELAADIRRHLHDQPVLARRPSLSDRTRKFVRRHRVGVTLSALLTLALASVVFGVLRSIIGARVERAFLALSELKKTEALVALADELWPAIPERMDEFALWMGEAEGMLDRLDESRRDLADLRARALPWTEEERVRDLATFPGAAALDGARLRSRIIDRRLENPSLTEDRRRSLEEQRGALAEEIVRLEAESTQRRSYRFASLDDEWQSTWLSELVAALTALADADTGLRSPQGVSPEHGWSIPMRRRHAERLRDWEQSDEFTVLWDEARAAIREHPDYRFDLEPQQGLRPLGPDSLSGLWEFAHLSSGEPAVRDEESGLLEIGPETGIVLVLIPRGSFRMGTPQHERGDVSSLDELSQLTFLESTVNGEALEVADVPPFFLSKCEMTRAQWQRATQTGSGAADDANMPLLPVDQVSWTECDRVTRRLGLALPTEEQWEYAARAGTTTPWWTGSDQATLWERGLDPSYPESAANLFDRSGDRANPLWKVHEQFLPAAGDDGFARIRPVGIGARNPFGLHDVHGNAAEWCRNPPYRYGDPPNPLNPARTCRGGCARDPAYWLRSAARREGSPELAGQAYGLRPSRELDRPDAE